KQAEEAKGFWNPWRTFCRDPRSERHISFSILIVFYCIRRTRAKEARAIWGIYYILAHFVYTLL
ncbi:hypothetical protein, partial [Labilibaculum sp.]|uniref:hypothetical protein n=1 Tax=Labilibaculum sp. TaxID=2060723 RepID=UPI0035642607